MNKTEEQAPIAYINPIFSKPLYIKQLNIDTKKIVSILKKYDFYFDEVKGINFSSASNSLYVLEDEKLLFLKDELLKEINLFTSDVMKYSNNFDITTSWFTKSTPGQSSYYHNHNNCMISGVLYLQTNENCGNLSFNNYDDKRYKLQVKALNLFNSPEWNITPKDGLLLMFPSEVYHQIQKNNSDTTRYSLSFNLVPTGLLGDVKADSHFISAIDHQLPDLFREKGIKRG